MAFIGIRLVRVLLGEPQPQVGLPLQGPPPQFRDLPRIESVGRELLVAHPDHALQPVPQPEEVEVRSAVAQAQLLQFHGGVEVAGGVHVDHVARQTAVAERAHAHDRELGVRTAAHSVSMSRFAIAARATSRPRAVKSPLPG